MQYLENKIICEVERFKSTSFITSGVRIMEDQKVHENKKNSTNMVLKLSSRVNASDSTSKMLSFLEYQPRYVC